MVEVGGEGSREKKKSLVQTERSSQVHLIQMVEWRKPLMSSYPKLHVSLSGTVPLSETSGSQDPNCGIP